MAELDCRWRAPSWRIRQGAYGEAVDHLFPVRSGIRRIGGSHAQRDLFEQLLIDAAWRGGRLEEADSCLPSGWPAPAESLGTEASAAVLDARGGAAQCRPRRELRSAARRLTGGRIHRLTATAGFGATRC